MRIRNHGSVPVLISAVIALAIPAVLIGNGLWLFMPPLAIDAVYALPGIPENSIGLSEEERVVIAKLGLESIRPLGDGIGALQPQQLPVGVDARFTEAEVVHMEDVKALVSGFFLAWAIGLAAVAIGVSVLVRIADRGLVAISLTAGGALTLTLCAFVGLAMLINFDSTFEAFHGIFFTADSWRFGSQDLLLQLYPVEFWVASATIISLAIAAQAAALIWIARNSGQ